MIKNDFLLNVMRDFLSNHPYFSQLKDVLTGMPQQVNEFMTNQISKEQNPSSKRFLLNLQWLSLNYSQNLYPDMSGSEGLEMMARWTGSDTLASKFEQVNRLGLVDVDIDASLLGDLMPMLQTQRSLLKGRVFNDDGYGAQLLKISLDNLSALESQFQQNNSPSAYLYFLDLAKAELYFRGGEYEAAARVFKRLENVDERLNVLIFILKADFIIAPFSSPLVWNRSIQTNAAAANDLPWQVEAMEIFGDLPAGMDVALKFYQKAERYYQKQEDTVGQAHLLLRFSCLFFVQEAYEQGLEVVGKAMKLALASRHFFLFYIAQTQQILYQIALGDRSVKRTVIEKIAVWGKGEGSFSFVQGLGIFITRMGRYWLLKKSEIDQALTCFATARYLFQELGAGSNEAQSCFDMGQLYETIGDTNNATYYYENGLTRFEQIINDPTSKIRKDIYRLYMMAANALLSSYMKKMDGIAIQQTVERMQSMLSMGVNHIPALNENPGMDAMIETFIGQSLEQGRIFAPMYQAIKAGDEGALGQAESLFDKALQQINLAAPASQHFYKGILAGQRRNYEEAKWHFVNYLNQGSAGMMGSFLELFKTAGSGRYQQEVIKQDQRTMEMAFTFMVRVKAYEDALKYALKVEAIAGKNWWQIQERPWEALSDYGELYEGLGIYDDALQYYDLAVHMLEDRRSSLSRDEMRSAIGSGKGIQYLYFYAARTAMKAGYDKKSLQYIELNKARALVELLEAPSPVKGHDTNSWQKWKGLNARVNLLKSLITQESRKPDGDASRIAYLKEELAVLQQEVNQLSAGLANQFEFLLAGNTRESFDVLDICQSLPEQTLLIEYFMLSESLLIWVLDRNGLKVAVNHQVEEKSVNRKIAGFYESCQNKDADWKKMAREIGDILLRPIKDYLDKKDYKHLLFVPHGAMHKLPFQALIWEESPLFLQFTISYLPSAHLAPLLQKAGKKFQPKSALVVGNPANMSYKADFSAEEPIEQEALPHSEIEAAYIAGQFQKNTLLLQEAATEKAVLEHIEQHSILVFSTHGVMSEAAPLNSSILLANGQSLALYELMGLDINAALVVLSACETALGEITGGDDVIGLSRGWFSAGAKSVLVSLWSINDRSTSLFMTKLFEAYQTDGKSILVAIQEAQQYLYSLSFERAYQDFNDLCEHLDRDNTRENKERGLVKRSPSKRKQTDDYSHPYYWAAFLYLGI